MDILRSSGVEKEVMLSGVVELNGGVVFRLQGEIRCGVVSRLRVGETRRFFFVDALAARILKTVYDGR